MSNGGWTTTIETMMTAAFNIDRFGKIDGINEQWDKVDRKTDTAEVAEKRDEQFKSRFITNPTSADAGKLGITPDGTVYVIGQDGGVAPGQGYIGPIRGVQYE